VTQTSLTSRAARGAAWSGVSNITLRLGGLVVGIILARILAPEQFGVYAVALTVQGILMTVADLGLSAEVIRSDDPDRVAPTVASIGLISGAVLAVMTLVSSTMLAELLGSRDAAPAIAVLSITLLLGGATVVPYAFLLRRFQQRELFYVGAADFVVSTTVTLTLVGLGFGVLGLAIGRVTAQAVSTVMLFLLARVRPRFAIDRTILAPVLAFSLPIAAANLLSWILLNVDNIVLARVAGAVALGYYVLAFNISNWPMSALSQVVRSIAMPYFSRRGDGLAEVTALAWACALPAGAVLASLASPLIEFVYGTKWLPAAPVLAALGVYGSLRVVFDIFAGYLYSRGQSRPVLWIQVLWLIVLVVGMVLATRAYGIVGAGWVHVLVAVAVILPAYLLVIRRAGVRVTAMLRAAWWPTLATAPAATVAVISRILIDSPPLAVLVGGLAALVVYGLLAGPWLVRQYRRLRAGADPVQVDATPMGDE